MSDLPDVTIVMTTWITESIRKQVVENTLATWNEYLGYEGKLRLHVADDGSTLDWKPSNYWHRPITYSRQERHGVGASLNAGFKKAFETSPIVLYAVDDWRLLHPFDITPWVKALQNNDNMGIMRLGPPDPFLRGTIAIVSTDWQGWALQLEGYGFTVGHRPELFHKRMIDHYGWFAEDINACECERLYSVAYANDPTGPRIFLALPHPWYHIHQDKVPSLSEIEPN